MSDEEKNRIIEEEGLNLIKDEEQKVEKKNNNIIYNFISLLVLLCLLIGTLFSILDYRDTNKVVKNLNIDTDGDNIPDLNIDKDNDDLCDINCDIDGDLIPNYNIDYLKNRDIKDRVAYINVDTDSDSKIDFNLSNREENNDGVCDFNCFSTEDKWIKYNIDLDGDSICDINCGDNTDKGCLYNCDINGDFIPDINIDYNKDGIKDYNITPVSSKTPIKNLMSQLGENEKCILNCDNDLDGKPDTNIDINGDKKVDINIDTNNDGKCDLNCDSNFDYICDYNCSDNKKVCTTSCDIDNDQIPDINIDTNNDGKCDYLCDDDNDNICDEKCSISTDIIITSGKTYKVFLLKNNNVIKINNIDNKYKEVQTFRLLNNTKKELKYTIKWKDVLNTFTTKNLKYSFVKDEQILKNYLNVPKISNIPLIKNSKISPNTTQTYSINYELNSDSKENLNKIFYAYYEIVVE